MKFKSKMNAAVLGLGLGISGLASAISDKPPGPDGSCFGTCKTQESICIMNASTPGQADACMEESFRCFSKCMFN